MSQEEMFYVDQSAPEAGLFTGTSAVDDTIPEIWSSRILESMKSRLVLGSLPGVNDRSLVGTAGDILHLPRFSYSTTAAASVLEGSATAVVALTTDEVTLTPIGYGQGIQFTEEMLSRSFMSAMQKGMDELGYALALKLEQTIRVDLEAAVNAGANTGQLIDKTGTQFSEDYFADARRVIRKNAPNIELTQLVAVMHPDHTVVLEKSTKFVDASVYGGNSVLLNGEIGRYLGIRILQSDIGRQGAADFDSDGTNDQDCWVLGPDAFRVAWKRDPWFRTQYWARYRYWDVVAHAEWDVAAYQPKHIVRIVADVAP